MKWMIASYINGSFSAAQIMRKRFETEKADRLILLGDLLYHGPRNDLPDSYNPKAVIGLLNEMRDVLLCVRGNCDAEVDQMVLDFPILADYAILEIDGRFAFVTHGHLYNAQRLPPHKSGDLLIHGHTHIPVIQKTGDMLYLNPGSLAIPKEGSPRSYMIYENGTFFLRKDTGETFNTYSL